MEQIIIIAETVRPWIVLGKSSIVSWLVSLVPWLRPNLSNFYTAVKHLPYECNQSNILEKEAAVAKLVLNPENLLLSQPHLLKLERMKLLGRVRQALIILPTDLLSLMEEKEQAPM